MDRDAKGQYLKIFPNYSKKERAEKTKASLGILLFFIFIFLRAAGSSYGEGVISRLLVMEFGVNFAGHRWLFQFLRFFLPYKLF